MSSRFLSGLLSLFFLGSGLLQGAGAIPSNLSSRGWAERGERAMAAGFVVSGPASGSKALLVRAAGPALAAFGVANALSAPSLELLDQDGRRIALNTGWSEGKDASAVASEAARLGAFAFTPGSRDCALLVHLAPGRYSALVSASGESAGGVALVELYDADSDPDLLLSNLSTRAFVREGAPLIAGFVLAGEGERQLLLRAVGPSLAAYGIAGPKTDPNLRLVSADGRRMDQEEDWASRPGSSLTATFASRLGAFPLPVGARDAAWVALVPGPSRQTMIVSDERGGEGVCLVELYDAGAPQGPAAPVLSASPDGVGRLLLSWSAVTGAEAYELLVDGEVQAGVSSPFLHSGLNPGSEHRYALRAVTATGIGATGPELRTVCSAETRAPMLWAGANQWQLPQQNSTQRSTQLLAMKSAGLDVLRLWVASRGDEAWQIQPTGWDYESPIGSFHADQLDKIDRLMAECAQQGIRIILSFASHANAGEPDGLYARTFGIRSLYEGEGLRAYRNRISWLLNHRNPYLNQRRWRDLHEVVLAWEVCNESGLPLAKLGVSREERYRLHRNFLGEMASQFKREDPVTLVSAGIAGYERFYSNDASDDIATLGDIPSVDIYTLHYYGGGLASWLTQVLPVVRSWGKRLVVEEFGNERKQGDAYTLRNYTEAVQAARAAGVPWMFWEMDLRKDSGTWGVMSDDAVWKDCIAPEAALIRAMSSTTDWGP